LGSSHVCQGRFAVSDFSYAFGTVGRVGEAYAREGTVVPQITLVREAVPHETELTLFHILFDGVQEFFLANLRTLSQYCETSHSGCWRTSSFALVQRGISTTIFKMVCCSLA